MDLGTNSSAESMITRHVKVYPPKVALAKTEQLAVKLAAVAADNAPIRDGSVHRLGGAHPGAIHEQSVDSSAFEIHRAETLS